MDGWFDHAEKAMPATLVRQFTPSRIERQLLAEVFELVYGRRIEVEESHSAGRGPTQRRRGGDGEQAIEARVAGRGAA